MGGLIKDFALTALIIILNHWVYGIEDTIAYGFIVTFITRNHLAILAVAFLGSFALVLSAALFENLGLYQITHIFSRVLARVTRFLVTFLAVLNMIFYAALGNNLMHDKGYQALFAVALLLGASCWALRIVDFNYPLKNNTIPVGILVLVSIVLVEFIRPL